MSKITYTAQDEQLTHTMRLLGDKTRYKIFKLLCTDSVMCVSEIADSVGISTSAASQHFRQLELTGCVEKERHGYKICYRLRKDNPLITRIQDLIEQ